MRLVTRAGSGLWLAYGMNVHPAAGVEGVEAAIRDTVLPLRRRLGARGPFGLALRLDGPTVEALSEDDDARRRLRDLLEGEALVPFTANGFVVGRFHGAPLKAAVYRPSWRERERLLYTERLAGVVACLRGPGHVVSLSTLPLAWRAHEAGPRVERDCARLLAQAARSLRALEEETGTRVVLGLEPEPGCLVQTTEEAVRFWTGPLATALARAKAAPTHLGACFDVCHQAVLHEDVEESLALLRAARVPVVKVQASAALEVPDPRDPDARAALAAFAEPVYLHQVGARDGEGGCLVAEDLGPLLREAPPPWFDGRPWRVHFHVPVFREALVPPLRTTRPALDAALAAVAREALTSHLEIETYSFGVLPEAERAAGSGSDLVEALAREYEYVLSVLERHGTRREETA